MQPLILALLALTTSETNAPGGFPELPELKEYTQPVIQEDAEPKWTGSITLGASYISGNTHKRGINLSANSELRRENDRTTLGALYIYSRDLNATKTEDRIGARGKYDYFLTEKTYAYGEALYDQDRIANLASRYTVGVGAGRQIREDEEYKLGVEGGVSYIDEAAIAGKDPGDSTNLRLGYNVAWTPGDRWNLGQTATGFFPFDEFGDLLVKVDTYFNVNLTESMIGKLQWLLDHDETPAPGAKRQDNQLLLSVGWSF